MAASTPPMIDPSEDAPGLSATPLDLKTLGDMCFVLNATITQAEELQERLRRLNATIRELAEFKIPEFMALAGIASVKLEDGSMVEVKENMTASVAGKTLPKVLEWLRANNHDGLIKTGVAVEFAKGKADQAEELGKILAEMGYKPELSENVNTGSFKSLVKELIEEGVPVPLEDLGIYVVKKAVLTPSKEN